MGEQGVAGGMSGGASSTYGLPDIAAAKSIPWNVELDRGLRSSKLGANLEAVLKAGPRLVWWSQEPVPCAAAASLYKLEAGQDRTFSNAIVQRLAETFRTGNNFTRLCVLKVFLLTVKEGKGKRGKHSDGQGKGDSKGLLTKERIANHVEMLRKVKVVMDSGDVVGRALALRMIGCLAEIASDSADVHRIVIEALQSPHQIEVEAAFFAMGRLCELSTTFAAMSFDQVVVMVNAMETPPNVQRLAIRIFAKVGLSPSLSSQAQKRGTEILLRLANTETVTAMLVSLTDLALESVVTIRPQVELLTAYISADPRAEVRALALQCFLRLIPQAARAGAFGSSEFHVLLAIIEDSNTVPALHILALQVIRKLLRHYTTTITNENQERLILLTELCTFHSDWQVAQAALACLVEIAAYSSKLKSDRGLQYKFFGHATQATEAEVGRNDDSVGIYHNATSFDFITRVGLLLCDHLAIVGSSIKGVSKDTKSLLLEKAHSLCTLVVQLSHECPQALPLMVESVVAIVKVVVHENFGGPQQGKPEEEETGAETREMDIDSEGGVKLSLKKNASMECQDSPVVISLTDHEDRSDLWLGFVLTLCKCIFVCVRGLELNVHRSAKVYPILRNLAVEVSMLDPPCEVLRGLLPAVLRTCSLQSQYACLEVRSLVETAVDKMIGIRDFWAVYRIATEAAVSGLWTVASHAFSILSSRVQSDGCYFWLEGLTKLAAAEASLTIDGSDVHNFGPQGMKAAKEVLTEVPISSEFSGSAETKSTQIKTDAEFGRRTGIGSDDDTQKCGMDSSGCGFKFSHGSYENDGCRFGEAASRAIPMFQSAAQSLAAGVCLERTFEFQRRVISLRLRLIQAVAELSKQVSLICANFEVVDSSYRIGKRAGPQKGRGMDRRGLYDMNIGILEPDVYDVNSRGNSSRIRRKGGEDQAGDCFVEEQYLRQENWRFRVFAVKAVSKAAQLKILTRELDLFSISFPGIDKESFHLLCEWAVSCSLLAFCTSCVFSKANAGCSDLEPRGAARDLNQRLKKCYGYESSQLSNFSAHLTEKLGSQELDSQIPCRFLKFCQWAIKSVFELLEESEAAGLKKVQERVGLLLKRIIGEWIQLPSHAPKFFFCTWPRVGVELHVVQTGMEESTDITVTQGSTILLNLCVQLTHLPSRTSCKINTLFCIVSIKHEETSSLLEEDLYSGWRIGFNESDVLSRNQSEDYSVVENLVRRSTIDSGSPESLILEQEMISTHDTSKSSESEIWTSLKPAESVLGRSFFSGSVDAKGLCYSSCLLDVTSFGCGSYQISLHCVGVDAQSQPWVLLSSHVRHTFKIV